MNSEKVSANNKRLSDMIQWDQDTMNLLDSLLARMRTTIGDECRAVCFRNNKPRVSKGVLLNVLHGIKPISWFLDTED